MPMLEDEALEPKLEKMRERFVKIHADAKKANLEIGKEKKEKLSKLFKEVERTGVPLSAFKAEMTMLDHVDNAKGVRAKVVADDDTLKLEAFDRLTVLAKAGMPLFDSAEQKTIKANAKKRPPPDDDEDKGGKGDEDKGDGEVVDMAERREKAAAASASPALQ